MKCKSLRTVTFPESFDIFDFCSEKVRRSVSSALRAFVGACLAYFMWGGSVGHGFDGVGTVCLPDH